MATCEKHLSTWTLLPCKRHHSQLSWQGPVGREGWEKWGESLMGIEEVRVASWASLPSPFRVPSTVPTSPSTAITEFAALSLPCCSNGTDSPLGNLPPLNFTCGISPPFLAATVYQEPKQSVLPMEFPESLYKLDINLPPSRSQDWDVRGEGACSWASWSVTKAPLLWLIPTWCDVLRINSIYQEASRRCSGKQSFFNFYSQDHRVTQCQSQNWDTIPHLHI